MKQTRTVKLTLTGLCLAVILAVQIAGMPNLLTGIAVNAVFIFIFLYAGLQPAIFICILSPFGGIISGHLPAPMYPLLPVIIVGNLLLVLFYRLLHNKKAFLRVFLPSLAKGLFIYLIGSGVIEWLEILTKVKWLVFAVIGIQTFTAIMGIILGEIIFKRINRKDDSEISALEEVDQTSSGET
ncbi:MAG: hypothetical protein ACQETH_10645 [Candidatus Rifleibacteriota bacterium]